MKRFHIKGRFRPRSPQTQKYFESKGWTITRKQGVGIAASKNGKCYTGKCFRRIVNMMTAYEATHV